MADVNRGNRPLSPFMFGSLYRWQISSVTSSLHRITGVVLTLAFGMFALWLISAAVGGKFYGFINWIATSWLMFVFWILALWSIMYHLLNGIRHLVWDTGHGFDLETVHKTGKAALIGSAVLTVFFAIIILI